MSDKSYILEDEKSIFTKPGYEYPDTGVFVSERNALQYALEQIENGTEDEKQDFMEWFYRNWYYEE